MSRSFIHNCCWITASFTSSRMKDLCQKTEGKTNFSRCLKQFEGWLTLILIFYERLRHCPNRIFSCVPKMAEPKLSPPFPFSFGFAPISTKSITHIIFSRAVKASRHCHERGVTGVFLPELPLIQVRTGVRSSIVNVRTFSCNSIHMHFLHRLLIQHSAGYRSLFDIHRSKIYSEYSSRKKIVII